MASHLSLPKVSLLFSSISRVWWAPIFTHWFSCALIATIQNIWVGCELRAFGTSADLEEPKSAKLQSQLDLSPSFPFPSSNFPGCPVSYRPHGARVDSHRPWSAPRGSPWTCHRWIQGMQGPGATAAAGNTPAARCPGKSHLAVDLWHLEKSLKVQWFSMENSKMVDVKPRWNSVCGWRLLISSDIYDIYLWYIYIYISLLI